MSGEEAVLFKEVPPGASFFTEWELEEGDQLFSQEDLFDPQWATPFTVDSITEFWAGGEDTRFLAGAILWDANREPVLSIDTETDEIELMSKGCLNSLINEMPFIYGSVEWRWYNQGRTPCGRKLLVPLHRRRRVCIGNELIVFRLTIFIE